MRKVEHIIGNEPNDLSKPIEFKHLLSSNGELRDTFQPPCNHDRIVYLGKHYKHGDMFVGYYGAGYMDVYVGKLNSGTF